MRKKPRSEQSQDHTKNQLQTTPRYPDFAYLE